jgi:phosphatidylserine/phosphatidylglycerophosphate/cardiolipin synthase-like enzyme/uncharacterized membrane protein YdjX (TVP38/TMEM64 family)
LPKSILRKGRNVWRIERAKRAAVIIDGAALFAAVRESMIKAKRSIFILGWDIDSRMRLVGESGEAADGYPLTLSEFLSALVERRPELTIYLLLWDYSVLYSFEREFFPRYALNWTTPDQVRVCLDNEAPLGCSQHQKVIVIDDCIAYSGGLDLTIRRWDTPEHSFDNPHRVDPSGEPYPPFHDVQAVVEGKAATALAELARERWRCASCETPREMDVNSDDCWPASVTPDFTDIDVGISRTIPEAEGRREIREVERLFLDSIDAAEHSIYIENQFLTSEAIAKRLAQRMRKRRSLETVIVAPKTPENWLEARTMRNGRIRFKHTLEKADVGARWRLVYPEVTKGDEAVATMIHSKVMAIDDRLLRIGSANINQRSMGADTECDLAFEAHNPKDRAAIACVRNRLLGEHCGRDEGAVAELLDDGGSLVTVVDTLSYAGHSLRAVDDGEPSKGEMADYIEAVADPPKPLSLSDIANSMRGKVAARSAVMTIVTACCLLLALIVAWQYSPLSDLADPDVVRAALVGISGNPFAPLLVIAAFLAGGLVAFPITVLIAATSATFGPWLGFAYATMGAMASALVTYGIGVFLGRETLRHWLGPRMTRFRKKIVKQGVLAVVTIRLVPIAPFTLVNLAAGASGIRLLDYVAGTFLGLLPGLLAMAALGHQVMRVLSSPTVAELGLLALGIAGWLALSFAVQAAISRFGDEAT